MEMRVIILNIVVIISLIICAFMLIVITNRNLYCAVFEHKDRKLWIARDKDGTLVLSNRLPYLPNKSYDFFCFGDDVSIYYLDRNMFPEVTFENSPQQVELVIKK